MDRYEERQRSNDSDRAAQMEAGKPSRDSDVTVTRDRSAHGKPTNQRDPDEGRSGSMQTGKPRKD